MKDIKEFLPFYMGCDCKIDHRTGKLRAIFDTGTVWLDVPLQTFPFETRAEQIKPLLRDIASMTEEDKEKLIKFIDPKAKNWKVIIGVNNSIQLDYLREGWIHVIADNYSPEMIRFLCKEGFDIFQLIPEGLAIKREQV